MGLKRFSKVLGKPKKREEGGFRGVRGGLLRNLQELGGFQRNFRGTSGAFQRVTSSQGHTGEVQKGFQLCFKTFKTKSVSRDIQERFRRIQSLMTSPENSLQSPGTP